MSLFDPDQRGREGQEGGDRSDPAARGGATGAGGEAAKQTPGSASNLATYLRGIDLPVTKQDLLRHAEKNNAPDEVRQTIQNMPDQQYQTMPDIMKAFGQVR